MNTITIPEGWRLVPVGTTPEMVVAGVKASIDHKDEPYFIYQAMLDAAPQPPKVEHQHSQPLTDVQVHAIWDSKYRGWFSRDQMEHITRAIEHAHGIKERK